MALRFLALCGSARRESFNRRLLAQAVAVARDGGAEVTELALTADLLPLFDEDAEAAQGLPAAAIELKRQFAAHDGFLIASPEYNGFFTPLLKNAIDWASRPVPGQPSVFAGKCAVLFAASAGALGGLRGLPHLRLLLSNLGVLVAPGQMALAHADTAFDAAGRLADQRQQAALDTCVADGLRLASALRRVD